MKRTYIPSEYTLNNVNGTFITKEFKTILGSTLIKLPSKILISNDILIFYQNLNNEQLDKNNEILLDSHIYDSNISKEFNTTISVVDNLVKFDIKYREILKVYIYSVIKANRVFEGILNNMTSKNNVDTFIYDYIDNNIISKFLNINIYLYINYNATLDGTKYHYSDRIKSDSTLVSNYDIKYNGDIVTISYKSNMDLSKYKLEYMFDLESK